MHEALEELSRKAALELCAAASLCCGQIVVIGCSTSEITGRRIGSASNREIGSAVFHAINEVLVERGVFLAAQCCEHLNRALIVERAGAAGLSIVNAIPLPEAGGAFATAAYNGFNDPVAVEEVLADAGLDIGGTLIGMHLKRVAVPVRLEISHIGEAPLTAARTRPKFTGGSRAKYDDRLL